MDKTKNFLQKLSWKKLLLGLVIVIPLAIITIQFLYPFNKTALYANVGGFSIGGMTYDEATNYIDKEYKESKLEIFFGDASGAYRSPSLETLGVTVDSEAIVESASYPLWMRFIPTSLWWGHLLIKDDARAITQLDERSVREYAEAEFGDSCKVTPKNASIVVKDSKFTLSPAADGGTCELDDIVKLISSADVTKRNETEVRVAIQGVSPAITDKVAEDIIAKIEPNVKDGIELKFEKETIKIEADVVRSWIMFIENKDKIDMKVDAAKVKTAVSGRFPSIEKKAGSLTVKMKDGKETSRSGSNTEGRTLNVNKTVDNISKSLLGKEKTVVEVVTSSVKAQVKYEQSYTATSAGFSAMLRRFAESNPGVYGVSLVELSGQRRTASYNDTRNFFPASTYKLFVAFSTIKRVENGTYKWSDRKVGKYNLPGGQTLSACFDTMIVNSDNACAETLRDAITYGKLNQDLQSIGIYSTKFIAPGEHRSNARDLTSFLVKLESGSLPINGSNRSKLLGAMKRNVYRSGVPSGASGAVADKVGFIWALLHDAAIVYSPKGTYAVTIMTDGSSWGHIAKLTREIEKFRAQ